MGTNDAPDHLGNLEGISAEGLDRVVSDYVDRLNAGEELNPFEILAAHPTDGTEILHRLEAYTALEPDHHRPLGTLGDYTLRRQIGRGGMGVVYEAWQNSVERTVALKILPGAVASDDRAFQRFMREARTAAKLHHPNIVGVHGMGQEDNTPYFAMEYVEGETLAQVLQRIRDADPDTETVFGKKDSLVYFGRLAEAFADVADGLQHAHSRGVVHRDVKPSNLILDATSIAESSGPTTLRILDFGLARLEGQESLTLSGDFVGTPLYMSPEQARRRRIPVDHRTDIYSLGATMYEALCGRPPFRGKDHADTLSQIIDSLPVDPRRLNPRSPRDLETIALKCLRKEAGDRYGTAEALGQDLRRFVRGDPIEARPQSEWERLAGRLRRHRTKLLVTTTLAVLASLVAGLTYRDRRTSHDLALARYETAVLAALDRIDVGRFSVTAGAGRQRDLLLLSKSLVDPVRPDDFRALLGEEGKRSLREAAEILRSQTDAVPDGRDAHYHLARALRLLEDEDGAHRELELALGIDPEFLPARYLLRESGAGPVGMARTKSPPGSSDDSAHSWTYWWLEARAATEARPRPDRERALEAYDELIAWIESDQETYLGFPAEVHVSRGVVRLETGDLDGAKEDFVAARTLAPRALEPHLLLGKACFLADNSTQGRRTFERAYDRRDPGDRNRAALWITAVCISLGEFGEAQSWVGKLVDAPAVTERLMTFLHGRQGRWAEAVAAGERARDRSPSDLTANALYVSALIRDLLSKAPGESTEAVAKLLATADRAARLDPENPQVRFLGRAAVAVVRRHLQELDRSQIMKLMNHKLVTGAVSTVLAGIVATLGQAREVCDDFTVDWDPLNREPVAWVQNPWNAAAGAMEDAVVAGCGRAGLCLRGANDTPFGLSTEETFAGDMRVRVKASLCGEVAPIFLLAHFDVWSVSGYSVKLFGSGRIQLRRFDSSSLNSLVEGKLPGYAATDELDLELSTTGDLVEFRIWRTGQQYPIVQLRFSDETYRTGTAGFQAGASSTGVCFHSVCISESQPELFLRGDVDGNGILDITDPTNNLGYQFLRDFEPRCLDACDFNDDGVVDITDPIANLEHQFLGAPAPSLPGKDECGVDPTEDELECQSYDSCP